MVQSEKELAGKVGEDKRCVEGERERAEFSSLVSGHAPFIVRHGSNFRPVCGLDAIFVCLRVRRYLYALAAIRM